MKFKNQNKVLIIIFILFVLAVSFTAYKLFNPSFNGGSTHLTLSEKKWIEDNKHNIIDIAILNNLPVFGIEGKGIYFSFLNYFEEKTALEFNKTSYLANGDTPNTRYLFRILGANEDLKTNDLLFYEDNYVVVSKNNQKVKSARDLNNAKLGLLVEDVSLISSYLDNRSITYVSVSDIDSLITSFNNNEVNYIVIPKNMYLTKIVENNYFVADFLNGISKKYVLTLNGKSDKLNSIINKYYTTWTKDNLFEQYNSELFNLYCLSKNIDENSQAGFKSKRYVYGYIENLPYESVHKDKFVGLNSEFTNAFSTFANVEFTYKKFKDYQSLNKAIAEGNVDLAFNYYAFSGIDNKVYKTIEPFYGEYVILSHDSNDTAIDSLKGLKNTEVILMGNTQLASYISKNTNAIIKTTNNVSKLNNNSKYLVLLDYNTYSFYKNNIFSDYNVIYQSVANVNYNYAITKSNENSLFYNIFQFYLSGLNQEKYHNLGMNHIIVNTNSFDLSLLWLYVILVPVLLIVIFTIVGKRKRIIKLRNDDKTRFIDPLTSLKNRYYLSLNLRKWEENNVYPQAIVVIDLNNLKDINDAYGHEEGDRLIKAAANILINNQLGNTDIIRTDGNEFMIYMVGYDENAVTAYIRKLYQLLKDLPYDYGASLGYSMIEDDIKLIDDAINEAILDMITNKETKRSNEA